jgi:plastocyanin
LLSVGVALAWAARLQSVTPATTPTARPAPTSTPVPPPGEIRATISLLGPDKKRVPAAGSVLWIPETPAEKAAAVVHPKVASKSKRFDPRITVIPAGTTVDFPNLDNIFHNVFSVSEKNRFDLGLYRNGAFRSMTFDNPGLVRIYCNIHPQMAAYIMVVDGRRYSQTGADGAVTLPAVPPGKHALRAWDEKGGEWTGAVEVASGKPSSVAIVLDGSSWRETPHKNKYGKDYPPPDDDENRY